MARKSFYSTVSLLLLGLLTGCTSLNLSKPAIWPFNTDDKPGIPTQMAVNWTDTILYQPNQVPIRGFGGRIMFYGEEKKGTVKVEGSLVVYAFDEKNRNGSDVKPDRKFVFTKEQLATHYSKSKIGHSYSVWVPWDEAGGEQKEISLIVRFMPEKGNVLVGDQTRLLLPGKSPVAPEGEQGPAMASALQSAKNGEGIQQVSYLTMPSNGANISNGQNPMVNEAMRSQMITTIPLAPSSMISKPISPPNQTVVSDDRNGIPTSGNRFPIQNTQIQPSPMIQGVPMSGQMMSGQTMPSQIPSQTMPSQMPSQTMPNLASPQILSTQIPGQGVPGPIASAPMMSGAMVSGQMVPNPMMPNPMVPNPMMPNQIIPNQLVPNQMVSNPMMPNQMVPNQIIPNQMGSHQMVPHQGVGGQMFPGPMNYPPRNMNGTATMGQIR